MFKIKSIAATLLVTATLLAGCTGEPIENPEALTNADITKGSATSEVVLMEYADFQCPACGAYSALVDQVANEYGDRVKIVYRHFPLTQIHPNAIPAAKASEAANRQGKFWEMHDLLYQNQQNWSSEGGIKAIFAGYAEQLELDMEQYAADYDSKEIEAKIKRDMRTGNMLGVSGTPSFFVNGESIPNPTGIEQFAAILDAKIQETNNNATTQENTDQ